MDLELKIGRTAVRPRPWPPRLTRLNDLVWTIYDCSLSHRLSNSPAQNAPLGYTVLSHHHARVAEAASTVIFKAARTARRGAGPACRSRSGDPAPHTPRPMIQASALPAPATLRSKIATARVQTVRGTRQVSVLTGRPQDGSTSPHRQRVLSITNTTCLRRLGIQISSGARGLPAETLLHLSS